MRFEPGVGDVLWLGWARRDLWTGEWGGVGLGVNDFVYCIPRIVVIEHSR